MIFRAIRHRTVTTPTGRSDAAHIAAEISLLLKDDTFGAFRRFIQLADNLAAEHGASRVGLALTEPAPTGSAHWDAAIAALCEYRLVADALPVPQWINTRPGDPNDPWSPRTSDYDIPVDQTQVPNEFLARGILIEAATLESV